MSQSDMRVRMMMAVSLFLIATAITTAQADSDGQMASKAMLSQTCVGCHGIDGHSSGPASPSIGGQTKNYLISILLGYKFHGDDDGLDAAMEKYKSLEDLEIYTRYSTIMGKIMQGYTVEEIIQIADYYSSYQWKNASQPATDSNMMKNGKKYHKKYCEKCHEEGGTSDADDVGILAGQWLPYLEHSLSDYAAKRNNMPKKMKSKLEDMIEAHGKASLGEISNFYADQ